MMELRYGSQPSQNYGYPGAVVPAPDSPSWWCSCTINGAQHRKTTGEESLARAKDVARDWYLTLLGKVVVAAVGTEVAPTAASLGQVGKYLGDELRDIGRKRNAVRPEGHTFAEAAESGGANTSF
jgi:hypothetical protein